MAETNEQINNHAGFIWSVADLLRGASGSPTEKDIVGAVCRESRRLGTGES